MFALKPLIVAILGCSALVGAAPSRQEINRRRTERVEDFRRAIALDNRGIVDDLHAESAITFGKRQSNTTSSNSSTITFANPAAQNFYVDGSKLPNISFDVGPSYASTLR